MSETLQSPDRCTGCGVYYAKFKAQADQYGRHAVGGTAPYAQQIQFSEWLRSNPSVKFFAALLASFIIGYFVGREHIKYQITSAMSETIAGIGAIFSGNREAAVAEKLTPALAGKPAKITARLLNKNFIEGEYGQDQITMTFVFTNRAGADVRAFGGVLILTDLLGNKISTINIAINEPVLKGQTLSWSGGVDYNQFLSSDKRLRSAAKDNIKVLFEPKNILYADDRLENF